jgi:site-specific recombinase XerD
MRLVSQCQRKRNLNFAYALRSFTGYLEGTEKSAHTIKNYRSDLLSFQNFLEKGLGGTPVALFKVNREDIERYHSYLKAQGLKTNTRRRKLLTVRKMLRFLTQRNKIALDIGKKLPAPHKIERVPLTVKSNELIAAIQKLPKDSEIQIRNHALLWTLAETGCQVSEVTRLRLENWITTQDGTFINFGGKSPRTIPISPDLYGTIQSLKSYASEKSANLPWLFLGFNKFGTLGAPITARGVELLVKAYAERLGFNTLTPRTFRHSIVLKWFTQGLTRDEIQKRLGLKTAYAFRVYEPLFKSLQKSAKSSSETTSIS